MASPRHRAESWPSALAAALIGFATPAPAQPDAATTQRPQRKAQVQALQAQEERDRLQIYGWLDVGCSREQNIDAQATAPNHFSDAGSFLRGARDPSYRAVPRVAPKARFCWMTFPAAREYAINAECQSTLERDRTFRSLQGAISI